jgi:hypothetical protein
MTIAICLVILIVFSFAAIVFKSTKYKPEDAAAMRRTFYERHKTIWTLTRPSQFEILKQHINDDAIRFRLVVSPDLVNAKVDWLMQEIDKRTDELFKPVVEIDWLYDFSIAQ